MYLYIGMTVLKPNPQPALDEVLSSELATAIEPTLLQGFQHPQGQMFALVGIATLVMSFTFPKMMAKGRAKTMPVGPLATRVQMKFIQFVLGCALNESVAIVGLIAGFIVMHNAEFGSTFIYVSMAAMLLRFPTEESLRDTTPGPPTGSSGRDTTGWTGSSS